MTDHPEEDSLADDIRQSLAASGSAGESTASTSGPGATADDFMLGLLALKSGRIDNAKLDEGLKEQEVRRTRGEEIPIGEIFVQKGWITQGDLSTLRDEQNRRSTDRFRHPRYELRGRLGEGATSVVHRGWDRQLKRSVAIKVLRESAAMSEVARERFRREAQAAGGLSHPNVVAVYDVGETKECLFIVLELIEGDPLSELLRKGTPRAALLEALRGAAEGVAAAHEKNVVHRDLKPQNILVTKDGRAKVGDFGLAHLGAATLALTRAGSALGTPLYMAPEQVKGTVAEITPRTDVYALGAILYEILRGTPPFPGETVAEIYRKILSDDPPSVDPRALDVPRDVVTVAGKALDKSPARRYPGAREFAEDLRRALAGEPIDARPEGMLRRAWRRVLRNRAILAASLILVPALLLAAGLALRRQERFREGAREATRRAHDFAREHPEDADGQLPLWKDALQAAVGTSYEPDARRELEAASFRLTEIMTRERARLDERLASLEAQELFGAAREELDHAQVRRVLPEWTSQIAKRSADLDGIVSRELARAAESCRSARPRGAENEVSRVRGRIERWGLPKVLQDFDETLARIPVPRPIEDPALVAYFPLDEGKGEQPREASGKFQGRIVGGAWVPGMFGAALRFDGRGSMMELPNTPELDRLQEGSYTLAAWAKPEPIPPGEPGTILGKPGHHLGICFDQWRRFHFEQWIREGAEARFRQFDGRSVSVGDFHHVVGVVDADKGQTRLYVDGAEQASGSWTPRAPTLDYGRAPWRLGCAAPDFAQGRYAGNAVIDEVRLYSRALSADEVAFLFHARPATASTWIPLFDGKTTGLLSAGSQPYWIVDSGSLVHAPGQSEVQAGQSRENYGDGEFRLRVEVSSSLSNFYFAARDFGCRAAFFRQEILAMGEGEHVVILICRGNQTTATLDGKPTPVEQKTPLPARGRLQWNSKEGAFRVLSVDYRNLP